MEYRKIEYLINKKGEVEEKIIQGHGPDCLAITKDIEMELGELIKQEVINEYLHSEQAENNNLKSTNN